MIWQDALFAVGGVGFAIALLPAVLAAEKPPLSTSLYTGAALVAFVVAYATLDLWGAAATSAASAAMWLILAWQRWRRG